MVVAGGTGARHGSCKGGNGGAGGGGTPGISNTSTVNKRGTDGNDGSYLYTENVKYIEGKNGQRIGNGYAIIKYSTD